VRVQSKCNRICPIQPAHLQRQVLLCQVCIIQGLGQVLEGQLAQGQHTAGGRWVLHNRHVIRRARWGWCGAGGEGDVR
jgi:hypothetical protein